MDHVCRTAAFDRHEYLGTNTIRAMFRKVDGGESKRGQINKEGNGSSLSLSLSLFFIYHTTGIYTLVSVQQSLASVTSVHCSPAGKYYRTRPNCILIFSASRLKLKRSSRILTDIPLLLTKYIQRLQIEGRGEEREREIVSMEANGVATLSAQWRSTLASGLIIVRMRLFRLM